MSSNDAKGLFQTDPCSKNQWALGIQLGVNFPNCSRAAILDHPWADRQTETERDRCSKLEIELTLPKQLIPRSSSRDTTTNTVATVATAHAGVCSSDFCCSAMFWSTGPKTNSLHLHTHLQLKPKIFYGKKNSWSQDQAALQQHELYKTCAFAASEIKMHRFQRQLHQFIQNLLPINYCSRYLEFNSVAAGCCC